MDHDEGFVQDIVAHPEDNALRLIYADWLEERDDPRAEFLRLEAQLAGLKGRRTRKQRHKVQKRLRELRAAIRPEWLARLDRTAIENCQVQFAFRCPKRWEKLQETEDSRVRFCEACGKNVHFCGTVAEARQQSARASVWRSIPASNGRRTTCDRCGCRGVSSSLRSASPAHGGAPSRHRT
jgi:uncharacterized protein (TIGR02996 family)